jgi:trehalose 6-phosphate phosphatase
MIDETLATAFRAATRSKVLVVACDFDGTLAPLVDDPSMASPDRRAIGALTDLGAMEDVRAVIISGRSPDVLARLTGAPPGVTLIGNHGANHHLDRPAGGGGQLGALVRAMEEVHAAFPGTRVEAKPHGAALHYRNAEAPDSAARQARQSAELFDGRIIEGKDVVEVVLGEGDKGTAIDAVRRTNGADCVIFFGDDTTDEDVFAVLAGHDVGVKVGDGPSLARYRVDTPSDVADALMAIFALRNS